MLNYTTLTAEEYIRVNQDEIDPFLLKVVDDLQEKIDRKQFLLEEAKRFDETMTEQIYFAQELIGSIKVIMDSFPKKYQKQLNNLIENSNFEL